MTYIIIIFLVLLSGCFSGLTLGFFSLNLTSLERKVKLGNPLAIRIYPIRKRGNLLLCTLLLGNVAVNSAMAIFLGDMATGIIAGLISTGLIVIFGEIIPQAVFSRNALKLGYQTAWLVKLFIFIFYPIAYPLSWLLDKVLGAELSTVWNKREIEEIIKHHEDAEESEIDEDEERIMLGALGFSDMQAKTIATPRIVVYALSGARPIDLDLILEIKAKGFSRIPVYENRMTDNIIGILLVKDLLGLDLNSGTLVREVMRTKTMYAKQDILLDTLLNNFLSSKNHLACLFDEFGTFQGVITLEDIVEEILNSEIMDEMDIEADLRTIAKKALQKKFLQ